MSLRWTQEQLEEYQERRRNYAGYVQLSSHSREISKQDIPKADPGKENALQANIERFLSGRGFYFFHDRSRGANSKGHPDLVIALPGGRVLWIELKSSAGRLSPEQKQVRLKLLALGQEWHEVRSYRQFLEIVSAVGKDHECTTE